MSEKGKIRETAEVVEGLAKSVPLYPDAIQPLAREIGKAAKTLGEAVNLALEPLRALIWSYETIKERFLPIVAHKLEGVPKERIVVPDLTVAGPAFEALRFTAHSEFLRELYANLLASAMDRETAHKAHPCFVDIIRQMSPDEARIVRLLAGRHVSPLLSVIAQNKDPKKGYTLQLEYFSLLAEEAHCAYPELLPTYLSDLCRLGLAQIPETIFSTEEGIYEALENHAAVKQAIARIEGMEDRTPQTEKRALIVTALGMQFCDACVRGARDAPEPTQPSATGEPPGKPEPSPKTPSDHPTEPRD